MNNLKLLFISNIIYILKRDGYQPNSIKDIWLTVKNFNFDLTTRNCRDNEDFNEMIIDNLRPVY